MGDSIDDRKLHELTGQKSQRPSRRTFRRLSAGHRDQPRLASTVELSSLRRLVRLLPLQRPIQALLDESLPDVRTVFARIPNASAACRSVQFGPSASTFNNTRARPFDTNPFSRSRSSFASRTMYFFPISHPPAACGRAIPVR
jgi:hypothetical protein